MNNSPLLAIKCITYNQEKYIGDALKGFIMQKTNFPFIAIVHDDASTDRTAVIIRKYATRYPEIIKPIYETENQYSKHDGSLSKIVDDAVPDCVKYIAFCEGDDYWIDSNKLQMQVNFLEQNTEYGLCYTRAICYIENEKKFRGTLGKQIKGFDDLIIANVVPTLSIVMKRELFMKYLQEVKPEDKGWLMGDYPLVLWFSLNTKMKFLPFDSCVYRVLQESASHSEDLNKLIKFSKSACDIQNYFFNKYNYKKVKIFDEHRLLSSYYIQRNNRLAAVSEMNKIVNKSKHEKILFNICKSQFLFICLGLYHCVKQKFFDIIKR